MKNKFNFIPWYLIITTLILQFPFLMMILQKNFASLITWEMIKLNTTSIMMSVIMDKVTSIFLMVIILIYMSVMLFSMYYMHAELNKKRFIILVILFVISMFLLVCTPNLTMMLFGWDGLGITSFCLVIYYQNYKSLSAGVITALMNRIGDVMIILAIIWMATNSFWMSFSQYLNNNYFMIMMIIMAAMTKSAQIPFSSWLPAAMAAPTPVSALVHSSTLVTAGVFILIRFFYLMETLKNYSMIMLIIGSSTMIMASLTALKENDMKKVIALSTLSQLGIMFMSLGLKMPELTLFHLYAHAMFKAMLFILAGVMIHFKSGNQDSRVFGNSMNLNKSITLMFNISNLSLCSFPFMAGFYSKETIINFMMTSNNNMMGLWMILISIPLTIMYSLRMTLLLMMNKKKNFFSSLMSIVNQPWYLYLPMMILGIFVFYGGAIMMWVLKSPENFNIVHYKIADIPFMIIMMSFFVMWKFIRKMKIKKLSLKKMFLVSMWSMNMISYYPISSNFFSISHLMFKLTDKGWNEIIGPLTMYKIFTLTSNKMWKMSYSIATIGVTMILFSLFFMI